MARKPATTRTVSIYLPDLDTAREQALATLGEIARDELPDGDRRDFVVTIRDEGRKSRLSATLSLRVEPLD